MAKEVSAVDSTNEKSLDVIEVSGARVHNLKNIDITIPRNELVVITGLSGSGKSSLAFDTIYAEGQRRYIETFSAYARQFLGNLERPDVDHISGLSPVISIEQKTTNRNPRSTVGTVTEIYDFLRLLFARAGDAYSYVTGEKMVKYTDDKIADKVSEYFANKPIYILAPVVQNRKGHYKELFETLRKKGFLNVRIDGEIVEITNGLKLDRFKNHSIEIVIDKLKVTEKESKRLLDSLKLAMKHGGGVLMVVTPDEPSKPKFFSRHLMCPSSGISYQEPAPHSFSFNSPQGACPKCKGLGYSDLIDLEKVIPDKKLTISGGGIAPLGKERTSIIFLQIAAILEENGLTLKTPISKIPDEVMDTILYGTTENLVLKELPQGYSTSAVRSYDGVIEYIMMQQEAEASEGAKKWSNQFVKEIECEECHGDRLRKESLHFKIDDKNIAQLSKMDLEELEQWFVGIETRLSERQNTIAKEIIKEIKDRLGFMVAVGLNYLSLTRSARTLSGGESQRIRLATQIGSQLINVLYILDEPSIGLHQRDNHKLIASLRQLRDNGNSVLVVEHDKDMMLASDHLIDIGPLAGVHGGRIVAQGTPQEVMASGSLTANYLTGIKNIDIPAKRREGNGKQLIIEGASGNNLKGVTLKLPLGTLTSITGVSGSGKSTLINETLYPILNQHFYRSLKDPLAYKSVSGLEHLDKVVDVDQSPIGRTPRSNPATYTKIFDDIRKLYAELPESKIRGYKAGRFSFNVAGGRCETCKGGGYQVITMNFLPDVLVQCPDCFGKRYNRETLEVRYKGKSISDVLNMTIADATIFFTNFPSIAHKIKMLDEVGLGYITLGQSSTTLSGGEAQRVKLAAELAKKDTGQTIYILDEPTTGLHFEDIRVLLEVLQRLVDRGNTVLVIEHNMDVIKVSDWIIDIGPEGGAGGGTIVCEGTPETVIKNKKSFTAHYLKEELKTTK